MILPMSPVELVALGHEKAIEAIMGEGYSRDAAEFIWSQLTEDVEPVS